MGTVTLDNGWVWPALDKDCKAVVFNTTGDMAYAMEHVLDRRVCVQAGGNCGVWPKWLAERFETVHTFEPDPLNFQCLASNVLLDGGNIIGIQAALGNDNKPVGLRREARNCGAYYVDGPGDIPTVRIDDLGLDACGLIVLDIEGKEPEAFMGALETIERFSPILMYEDKGLSVKYGYEKGHIETEMAERFGYRVVGRPNRDVILAK